VQLRRLPLARSHGTLRHPSTASQSPTATATTRLLLRIAHHHAPPPTDNNHHHVCQLLNITTASYICSPLAAHHDVHLLCPYTVGTLQAVECSLTFETRPTSTSASCRHLCPHVTASTQSTRRLTVAVVQLPLLRRRRRQLHALVLRLRSPCRDTTAHLHRALLGTAPWQLQTGQGV
jgi:hypothetical protein